MANKTKKFIDAYGHELWGYFTTGRGYEIVERDDGYFDAGPGGRTYFSEYKDWNPIERRAMKYAKGRVLDIGCGVGRHALYLQKKFDVTGIDNSPLAIKICKIRGLKKAKILSIDDIYKFKPNSFDTIIMMGNNFGLLGSFKKAKRLLKNFYKITSKNALIIAQTLDPHQTKDPDHLAYHRWNIKRGRMPGQIRIRIRYKKLIGPWFNYLFVSKKEMKEILKDTGWEIRHIIEKKKFAPIYVAVIEKT